MSDAAAIAVVIIGVAVLGACVHFALRFSRSSMDDVRREVLRLNMALQAMGSSTGLRYVGGGEHQHPVVGPLPGYGSLHGVLRGCEVHVSVDQRDEDRTDLLIEVSPATGGPLTSRGPPPPTLAALAARGVDVRVVDGRLQARTFPIKPEEIQRTTDDALAAALELARTRSG